MIIEHLGYEIQRTKPDRIIVKDAGGKDRFVTDSWDAAIRWVEAQPRREMTPQPRPEVRNG